MDQGANQSDQIGGGLDSSVQTPPVASPDTSQEMPTAQPISQTPLSTQESVQPSTGSMSPTNQKYPSEASPPTTPPDITSVVTTSSGGKKSKKTLWIVLGALLLIAISVGGYFVYTGLSEKQSDPDQSLTNLPSPVLLPTTVPTIMPTMPTPIIIPNATESATLSLCDEIMDQATQSAHQKDFCQGVFCTSIETQVECLEVDVVATSGGVLSTKESSDGVGDCVWDDLASGFGSKCKVKYE